jgi:hypothetical protein
MSRSLPAIALWLSVALIGAVGASAQTRTEILRWDDSNNTGNNVTGYRIYSGLSSGGYAQSVDAGLPAAVDGVREYSVSVDATADVYFAVTAYNDAAESFFSNEICRGANGACQAPAPEPTPTPTPTPSTAQAGIDGFALWDAQADVVIDSSFTSGEQIPLDNYPCTAIEIVGNAYLSQSGSPGSVMYTFDGQTPSGCTNPGVTYENNPPYAWEIDSGPGKFECAATLTQPGSHTLMVTPFDGDDCTGLVGTPVTLSFDVISAGGATAPPPSEVLGTPGQPVLIQP